MRCIRGLIVVALRLGGAALIDRNCPDGCLPSGKPTSLVTWPKSKKCRRQEQTKPGGGISSSRQPNTGAGKRYNSG